MNGRVERMQITRHYAFRAACDSPHQVSALNPLIDAYAHRYNTNTYRLHDALGQRTSLQYLRQDDSADPLKAARPSQMSRARAMS